MMIVRHAIPRSDVLLGIVCAEHITINRTPKGFDQKLAQVLEERSKELGDAGEARRVAARDMLRNRSYKPTGRGKPASEYLLRSAADRKYTFPRINGPVDVCNYLSLEHVVPISLWDLDRAGTQHFVFRLGRPGEGYVFNDGGQRIDVEDLLVGCRVQEDEDPTEEPIVNPVRDSLATKTTPNTTRVAACIYAPADVFTRASLSSVCRECAELLAECGEPSDAAFGVADPQTILEL